MASIELVTQFQDLVDEKFASESQRSLVTNQNYSWTGAHTIKVYRISTAEMNDYARHGQASRYGEIKDLNATTQEMKLRKDRSFTFVIDKLDMDETGMALEAGTALERQVREVVIPEVDAYTYNEMCENAGTKPDVLELTTENIYDSIVTANETLDEAEVPTTERVLIVTPAVYRIMKKSKDIVLNSDVGNELRIRGVISNLDGCLVVKVPSNRLPKGFGFMLAHKIATVAPLKLEDYKIHNDPPGYNGDLVEGRICYDAFVLDNKAKAIYYQGQPVEDSTEDTQVDETADEGITEE